MRLEQLLSEQINDSSADLRAADIVSVHPPCVFAVIPQD